MKAILAVTIGLCCVEKSQSQSAFDRTRVSEALQQWTKKLPQFDRGRTTVLFTTSTLGCTPCCATAINHAIDLFGKEQIDANLLVVVATPIPREGLAIRKKFKTLNVAEDANGVLQTVFQADNVLPDMYIIDTAGQVRLHHHDLQHNMIDTLHFRPYLSLYDRKPAKAIKLHSVTPLNEDDDNVIGQIKSPYLDLKRGTLEFLEPRQNSIYRFNIATGNLVKVIPADESLALRLRDPNDRQDFWTDFAEHQHSMVQYGAMLRPGNTDTSYILGHLFTKYLMEIDSSKRVSDPTQPADTSITFYKSQCVFKMFEDSIVAVDSVPSSPWIMIGGAAPFGPDMLAPCVWDGVVSGNTNPRHRQDSAYSFLILKKDTYESVPVVRVADIEAMSKKPYDPRVFGPACVSGSGNLYFMNQRNGVFIMGRRFGDSVRCSLLQVGGSLRSARSFSASDIDPVKVEGGRVFGPDPAFTVSDVATNNKRVHLLVLNTLEKDSMQQITMQAYNMDGGYLSQAIVDTGADSILSAIIIGYDDKDMYVLLKRKRDRWAITRIALSDLS